MKEKYDFGKKKIISKPDNLQESTELKEQYDFVTEANLWAQAGKGLMGIANTTYTGNMLRGAGAGAVVGGVGNVAKNMVKRDDDPTKKGIIGSALSGAAKGAGTGAVVGAGARFAARTSLGMQGIHAINQQAIQQAKNSGVRGAVKDTITTLNSGVKSNALGRRFVGVNNQGDMVKAAGNKLKEQGKNGAAVWKGDFYKKGTDFNAAHGTETIAKAY